MQTSSEVAGSAPVGIQVALLRVVVGYRVVGALWLGFLAALVLLGGSQAARPEFVAATVVLVAVSTAATAAAARAPQVFATPAWILADTLVAAWALLSPTLAGSEPYYGGYPFSAVVLAVYGRGLAGGITAAVGLSLAAVARLGVEGAPALFEVGNAVLIHLLGAAVLAWGLGVLRRAETRRLATETALAEERAERRRSQERAETAAHLHDSVLQTLALIQRRSGEAGEVTALARRQEQALRRWLDGRGTEEPARTLRQALDRVAADVERDHQITVDPVVVGDAPLDERTGALVAAAGEALVNAAKHAGVAEVALFAEVAGQSAQIFVRDRGAGFDPDGVGPDRRGIGESIVGRLTRHGGTAVIRSAPGAGTEVVLRLPPGTAARAPVAPPAADPPSSGGRDPS
ncbi:MAG: hypothetical protein GEU81_14050 [Nitriliruptorales bacterium]|nr:hypothetical protein [Nitriliruptorales bacterium]